MTSDAHQHHPGRSGHHPDRHGDRPSDPAQFWEQHYGALAEDWGTRPNASLVRLVEEHAVVPPGPGAPALDLGAGHGGDAVWLAARGWSVTAVDVSTTALGRVDALAAAHAVGDAVTTERHDLAASMPQGPFSLVTASFFQTPLDLDRDAVLHRASRTVGHGGWLLVVDHAAAPSWAGPDHGHEFPTAAETLEGIGLGDGWVVERCERVTRTGTSPEGQQGELVDNLLVARRL
ncbi:class I SAM-dependent methyltransferase [Intrasporangium flavum]|uniref:class I SAM-dependent methyltransferase n=1 Tax=Intrasporangium flavum TaxID=1428657 RepID=UPI00096CA392|nr:methyltransferase domain-containing protein [Intrasporangium flavum]